MHESTTLKYVSQTPIWIVLVTAALAAGAGTTTFKD